MPYVFTGLEKCPDCKCLLDDHLVPEDIERHEHAVNPSTCLNCSDCYFNPRFYDPDEERQNDLYDRGDAIMDQRRDDAMTEAKWKEGY